MSNTPSLKSLSVKIYADGADKQSMLKLYRNEYIKGFTTNPTLMAKAGIKNYEAFAKEILAEISDRSISFEVFSDELSEMETQARRIKDWGPNVYVKIPVMNSKGVSCAPLIKMLTHEGIQLNVTAILTLDQCSEVCKALSGGAPSIISVFAGRIADTGREPVPFMLECAGICRQVEKGELLWASTREVINIFHADAAGCKIVTVPHDILAKISGIGRELYDVSLDTVKMFLKDSVSSGFSI